MSPAWRAAAASMRPACLPYRLNPPMPRDYCGSDYPFATNQLTAFAPGSCQQSGLPHSSLPAAGSHLGTPAGQCRRRRCRWPRPCCHMPPQPWASRCCLQAAPWLGTSGRMMGAALRAGAAARRAAAARQGWGAAQSQLGPSTPACRHRCHCQALLQRSLQPPHAVGRAGRAAAAPPLRAAAAAPGPTAAGESCGLCAARSAGREGCRCFPGRPPRCSAPE